MLYKKVEGFTFLHVANAFLSQVPLKSIYEGRKIEWETALDLLYPEVADAESSCYLIYLDDEVNPVYVGQYTGVFKDRWGLKKGKYIWHGNNDDSIKFALIAKRRISIWLSLDPYVELSDGRKININKEIEQIIIEEVQPKWNVTSKKKVSKIGEPVSKILSQYEKKLPDIFNSLLATFEEKNLDSYLEQLLGKGEKNWSELQDKKMTDLSRCRHFINYISSGIQPDNALEFVWKEFP
ncbi:hypothetical protein [Rheinheimera salexigens]|uniref:GIY-YIG domain-containing protein n=1 Tax=Rheinheimera salexigens TaxID=1628148 RepID=A0A1E7Q616_9GAMM|nr:hypothetical protein [Rheinheimera salexigens]OEY69586.1 hypothetical protein BI198_08455 [Rheinheimera salexigens]